MDFKFHEVLERDMDFLFLEEFAVSQEFLRIFTSKVGIEAASVEVLSRSETNAEFGESDLTVILNTQNGKHALLIEDKIDAIAMPEQPQRYISRGNIGIRDGKYNAFDVFIVAPDAYLQTNSAASEYPNKVSYEEVKAYFAEHSDYRSQFKLRQIDFAIDKQKSGYTVIEHKGVTDFWECYRAYQSERYPNLQLVSKGGKKGAEATWLRYHTDIQGLYIFHKTDNGYVDLTFNGTWEHVSELDELLKTDLGDYTKYGLRLQQTKKSSALRLIVPMVDVHKPFEDQILEIDACFQGIAKVTEIAGKLDTLKIRSIIKRV